MSKSLGQWETIYASLRRAILEQALKPGTKLPEDSIGEAFGVSRTSVRNVLIRLSAEGLVDLRPNRGASVATPTLEEAIDVFAMRRAIEAEVLRRLCQRINDDILGTLEGHLRQEESALRVSVPRSIRLAGEFHILLAELTGSAYMTDMVNQVVSRSSLILAQFARPHSAQCGVDEHRALIDALKARDADCAVDLMLAHLESVEGRARVNEDQNSQDVSDILRRYAEAHIPD